MVQRPVKMQALSTVMQTIKSIKITPLVWPKTKGNVAFTYSGKLVCESKTGIVLIPKSFTDEFDLKLAYSDIKGETKRDEPPNLKPFLLLNLYNKKGRMNMRNFKKI